MDLRYFWYTKDHIAEHTGGEYVGIEAFGTEHIIELVLALALCIALGLCYRRMGERGRRITRWVLVGLMLADEVFKQVGTLATGQFEWGYLPLHLCSINIFVCLAHAIKPNKLMGELLYGLCIPGAMLALLFPTWKPTPVLNFMHLHSYTIHVLLVAYPVMLLFGGFRPSWRNCWKSLLCIGAVCPFIYVINKLLDTNFMFLNRAEPGTPLTLFEGWFGTPGYLLGMPILLVLIWAVMYLPWAFSGQCSVDSGQCSVDSGRGSGVSGQCSVDSGQCSVDSGQCSVDSGRGSGVSGQCSVDSGQGAADLSNAE